MCTRKGIILLLVLTLVMGMIPMGSFAAADYSINSITTSISTIYENDTYSLTIKFNLGSSTKSIDKVTLKDNTVISPTDGILTKAVTGPTTANPYVTFNVKQASDSNLVSIVVNYVDSSNVAQSATETFVIPGVQKNSSSTGTTTPTNTVKYKPTLKVTQGGTIPTIESGEQTEITFDIENTSKYSAKDINLTLQLPDGSEYPFVKNGQNLTKYIKVINKEEKTTVKIPVTVNSSASSKVHEFVVKLQYTNSYGDEYTNSDYKYYFKVKNDNIIPIISNIETSFKGEEVIAGKGDVLALTIQNKGTIKANDVSIVLSGFSKDGIRLNNDVSSRYIPTLAGNKSEKIYYAITTSENLKSGVYEIEATYKCIDDNGKEYETKGKIYIPVDGKDPKSINMDITNIEAPNSVSAGEEFEIKFDITNNSSFATSDTEVSMEYPESVIPISSPKKYLKEVAAGAKNTIVFKFKAKDDIETGHYDYYINTKYNIKGGTKEDEVTVKEYIGQYVEGSSGLGRPKIIIEDFDFGGDYVLAGEEFDLVLYLFNTSNDESIKNIKVKVESPDGVFTPVDSSSSVFVESIGKRDTAERLIRLKTKNDSEVKSYSLNVIMEYEDSKGNAYDSQKQPYKEEEKITVPVSQPVRLEVGEINVPMDLTVGRPLDLEVEFYNLGKSKMFNLLVKLEGDLESQGGSFFVGNFEPGSTQYFQPTIYTNAAGEFSGKIVFTYEDASGVEGSFEKEFSFSVMDGGMGGGEDFMGGEGDFGPYEEPDQGNPYIKWIIGGLALVALAAGAVIIMKKRKKKKMALLEAEDDDE